MVLFIIISNILSFIKKNVCIPTFIGLSLLCVIAVSQNSFAQKNSVLGGSNKVIIPYPHLHEADVMYSKQIWRVIDLREKMNLDFYFPTENIAESKSLMQLIWHAITVEESITAYEDENDGELKTVIPVVELLKRFNYWDTTQIENPATGQLMQTVTPHLFQTADVKQFRIKEEWYFNKEQSLMQVKIVAICPVLYTIKNDEPRIIPMFWFYFPEARTPFKKVEVFNKKNDTEKMTYEEVFLKRKFSSYVYKQSNVYNRRISKYLIGADGLLESESIKEEMRNAEADWWEY